MPAVVSIQRQVYIMQIPYYWYFISLKLHPLTLNFDDRDTWGDVVKIIFLRIARRIILLNKVDNCCFGINNNCSDTSIIKLSLWCYENISTSWNSLKQNAPRLYQFGHCEAQRPLITEQKTVWLTKHWNIITNQSFPNRGFLCSFCVGAIINIITIWFNNFVLLRSKRHT